MTGFYICAALYVASLIFSRIVLGKGLETLSSEDKGKFMNINAYMRKWSLIFLVAIIVLFTFASRFGKFPFWWVFSIYIASLVLFNNGVIVILTLRKLKTADMPEFFLKKFVISSLIKIVAIILVAAALLYLIQTRQIPTG